METKTIEQFGLPKRFRENTIYYDVFTNQDIVHTYGVITNRFGVVVIQD